MKTHYWFAPALFLLATSSLAQTPKPVSPDPVVVERGPNYRIWQRRVDETLANGSVVTRQSGYTEIAVGMHYLKDGVWTESKEEIELFQDGAIARQGQIQVIFAPNIATAGAIDLLMADGKRWRTHVLGIAVYDKATGNSELVAAVKDSIGELHPPNVILYPDAFSTDTGARGAIRYTYSRDHLEQDIVLFNRLDLPPGFDPVTSQLEVWTEAVDFEEPEKIVLHSDGATDQTLVFGAMRIMAGQAVPLHDPQGTTWSTPIYKQWIKAEGGRTFLVESCPYPAIKDQLNALPGPVQGAAVKKARPARQMAALKPGQRPFPAVQKPAQTGKIQMASLAGPSPAQRSMAKVKSTGLNAQRSAPDPNQQQTVANLPQRGLVLDYSVVTTTNDVTFKSDTTYYVSGAATLSGTTTLEGGSVIKCTNANTANTRLTIQGPVDCRTSAYRPVILTGKDDNSVGETITGSTGNPATNYYGKYIDLAGNTNAIDLHDIRIRHGFYGLNMDSAVRLTLSHAQLGSNWTAIVNLGTGQAWLRNVLIQDGYFTFGSSGTNRAEHVTFHRFARFRSSSYTNAWLTNCLIISVTNDVSYTGVGVVSNLNDSGFFQTVGSGEHYLASGSTNRNVGTTNINPDLLVQFKQRTTYPPIVLTNNITNSTVLAAQAQRDSDTPDLGYHYDCMDYVVNGRSVTNCTLTLQEGTVLAIYGGSGAYGLRLEDGAVLQALGSPLNPCRIVRYNLVQEQGNTNWSATSVGPSIIMPNWNAFPCPIANFGFTTFSSLAAGAEHLDHQYMGFPDASKMFLRNCQVQGGKLTSLAAGLFLTNCLLERVSFACYGATSRVQNCTFYGGWWSVDGTVGDHRAFDSFFDKTAFDDLAFGVTNNYNGYVTTNYGRLIPNGPNDRILTNQVYQTASLGRFYLESTSPLIDQGSTFATNVGLLHFTTLTNQTNEGTSTNDIGFHYLSLNANGLPVDTDSDTLPDYLEDKNGNGVQDSAETSFTDSDSDYDGRSDGQELVDGTDPLNSSSVTNVLLGYWRFNTNTWVGEQGQMPKSSTNLQSATSWNGTAVLIDNTNVANLKYRDVEANAAANINCRSGTVRFWFSPDWNSATTNSGTGPQGEGRLIELGTKTIPASNGWWGLVISSNGTQMSFGTQTNGAAVTNLTATVNWASNFWHQVALTYTTTNSSLYIDGLPAVTNGAGIVYFPSVTVRSADGFSLGSDKSGNQQGKGRFDELQTYNYSLSATTIQSDYSNSLNQDLDGDGVINSQDADPNNPAILQLKITIELPRSGSTVP